MHDIKPFPNNIFMAKIIPLVYDDTLSYYEFLCKVLNKLNEVIGAVNTDLNQIDSLVKKYVDEYIESGDISNIINALEDRIEALETNEKGWSGRKVLWVGDSYGNGWNGSTSITDPYSVCSAYLGCTYTNISRGGCRFGDSSTASQYRFITLLEEYVAAHDDMESYTDIIVIGGANDICHNPSADLSGSITSVCEYIREHFTNAKIHIGMVARLINTGSYQTGFVNFDNILKQYIKYAAVNGAYYIKDSELINHNYSLLASDGIHLTNYVPMGEKLSQLLLGGEMVKEETLTLSYTPSEENDSDNIVPTTISFQNTLHRGSQIFFDCGDLQFEFEEPRQIVWRKAYKFAKVSGDNDTRNLFIAGNKAIKLHVPAVISYRYSDVSYSETQPVTLYFYDNYLYLSWDGLLANGGTTLNNCTYIHLRTGFEYILDETMC